VVWLLLLIIPLAVFVWILLVKLQWALYKHATTTGSKMGWALGNRLFPIKGRHPSMLSNVIQIVIAAALVFTFGLNTAISALRSDWLSALWWLIPLSLVTLFIWATVWAKAHAKHTGPTNYELSRPTSLPTEIGIKTISPSQRS
jgi:hypothetical protein